MSRYPDESCINQLQNRENICIDEDWWPSIGPFVGAECLQHAHFRRYPGEWTQKCVDPRRLSKNLPPGDSCEDANTPSTVDGQHTSMNTQSDLERQEISQHEPRPCTTSQVSTHATSQTQLLRSPATSADRPLPIANTARPANNQQPSFVCHVAPCKDKEFNNMESLRIHDDTAHRYRCERGCSNVGYPSVRDLESRHYNTPIHNAEEGQYRCGRCGKLDSRQDNHTRHLGRRQPCQREPVAQQYVCGRCSHKTYDKEAHLGHLRRRGCQSS